MSSDEPERPIRARNLLGLGGILAGSVVGGLAVGELLDDRLRQAPVFTLSGIAVGLAAGIWISWLRIRQSLRG